MVYIDENNRVSADEIGELHRFVSNYFLIPMKDIIVTEKGYYYQLRRPSHRADAIKVGAQMVTPARLDYQILPNMKEKLKGVCLHCVASSPTQVNNATLFCGQWGEKVMNNCSCNFYTNFIIDGKEDS